MAKIPQHPKIFHITHVRNLSNIVNVGVLYSDARRVELVPDCAIVGMSTIKRRRLEELTVECHPGTMVGQYVPFYFCPRSIMLYMLHMGNHPDLDYRQGQRPIVHLQADLLSTVGWAERNHVRWAFSDRNAGARIAGFFNNIEDLVNVNWQAVRSDDFRDMRIKEGKQAEFLMHGEFPWKLVERIGVVHSAIATQVSDALSGANHVPPIVVKPAWYY